MALFALNRIPNGEAYGRDLQNHREVLLGQMNLRPRAFLPSAFPLIPLVQFKNSIRTHQRFSLGDLLVKCGRGRGSIR